MGNPFEGAVNFVGGLLGQNNAPSRQVADLDPVTKQLIEAQGQNALRSTQDYQNEAMSGIPGQFNSALQNKDQFNAQEQSGFAMNPAMTSAIHDKYAQAANQELSGIKQQSDMQARLMKGADLRRGFNLAMAQRNVMIQNMQAMANAQRDADILRSQVLGNIFGAAGTAIGFGLRARGNKQQQPGPTSQSTFAALAPGESNIGGEGMEY